MRLTFFSEVRILEALLSSARPGKHDEKHQTSECSRSTTGGTATITTATGADVVVVDRRTGIAVAWFVAATEVADLVAGAFDAEAWILDTVAGGRVTGLSFQTR